MSAGPKKQINPYEVADISPNASAGDIWALLSQEAHRDEFFELLEDALRRVCVDAVKLNHEALEE